MVLTSPLWTSYPRCYHYWEQNNIVIGHIDECSISDALAMDILQSCTKPSIYAILITTFQGLDLTDNVLPIWCCDLQAAVVYHKFSHEKDVFWC